MTYRVAKGVPITQVLTQFNVKHDSSSLIEILQAVGHGRPYTPNGE